MNSKELYTLGIDIGSTTVKIAILDNENEVLFSDYERHFANIQETLSDLLGRAIYKLGPIQVSPVITGSGGLTLAKHLGVPFVQEVIATALSVGESNACMRKIVAAPTAGACGVLPAVLVPLYQMGRATEEEILQALYTASGIGAVVSFRACIAGASGGCQAEIGTASAMAAGALTSLRGGDPQQIGHAAAMALKKLMGLVCDPVAGLVEVPCVKRNVVGSVNAVSCADMALAGVESRIPVDEVIDCMGEVGRRMPMEMRETALGGLAATPTGKAVKERMEQQD